MSDNLIGATTAIFIVSLSIAVAEPVDVAWSTRDGTAKAGTDYQAANGVVTFLPGETEKQIEVIVYGQNVSPTSDKNFFINLMPPTNAVLGTALIEAVIKVEDESGVPVTSVIVAQGKRGLKGDPGLSAYEQAVLMGYDGTLENWMQEQADAAAAAQRASDYAANAAAAAEKAENAATAASFLGNIFPTPEAGVDPVTGVQNGAYYNVRSPDEDSYLIEYQNIGGIPTPSGKKYPTSKHNSMSDRDVAGAHPASAISYGPINQESYNDGLEAIADMLAIQNPVDGMRVHVKSYYAGLRKGGGIFVYNSTKASTNDTGVVINGWERQLEAPPNPYHFGAYGDWNPTAQTGHDDSVPFQNCIDYILSNYTDFRGSKSGRQLTLEIGSYLVGGLQFSGSDWSFRMVGQGMYTQLWHKKELGRHVVNLEYTYFENIFFNGAAKPAAEPVDAVDYVFDFYLLNEALDIDTHFNNCGFLNCNTFARFDGRGFKTTNSMLGGCKVALLEIYCDPNALFPVGHDPAMQAYHSSMRHYVIDKLRVDASPGLVKITGTGSQIDHINGLTISNCEITNCYKLVDAPTATLVEPKIVNNFGILCFQATRTYAAVEAKGIVDGVDIGNQWAVSKYRGEVVTDRARCLAAMYRAETIDGLTLNTNVFKDLCLGVVRFTGECNNLKIVDSTFDNFAPINNGERLVWNESNDPTKATNILIDGNSITSASVGGVWMNNITGNSSFKAVNNIYPATFADQRIAFNPKLLVDGAVSGSVTEQYNKSYYEIDGNYINCFVEKSVTTTLTSGDISLQLPVAAVVANTGYSAFYSGSGFVDILGGFAPNSYTIRVHASTDQRAKLQLNAVDVNLSAKTGNTITVFCNFRYKFK